MKFKLKVNPILVLLLAVVAGAVATYATMKTPKIVMTSNSVFDFLKLKVDMGLPAAIMLTGLLITAVGFVSKKGAPLMALGLGMIVLAPQIAGLLAGHGNAPPPAPSPTPAPVYRLVSGQGEQVPVQVWGSNGTAEGARICVYTTGGGLYCTPREGILHWASRERLGIFAVGAWHGLDHLELYVQAGMECDVRIRLYAATETNVLDEGTVVIEKTLKLKAGESAKVTIPEEEVRRGLENLKDAEFKTVERAGLQAKQIHVAVDFFEPGSLIEKIKGEEKPPFKSVRFYYLLKVAVMEEEDLEKLIEQQNATVESYQELQEVLKDQYTECVQKCQEEDWEHDPTWRTAWKGSCEETCATWLKYHSTIMLPTIEAGLKVIALILQTITLTLTVLVLLRRR